MKLDPSIFARIQFAFTVSFHIIFPTMSLGLASFLAVGFWGIMLFGFNRVGPKVHFVATCMVAVGTLLSASWILYDSHRRADEVKHEIYNL